MSWDEGPALAESLHGERDLGPPAPCLPQLCSVLLEPSLICSPRPPPLDKGSCSGHDHPSRWDPVSDHGRDRDGSL